MALSLSAARTRCQVLYDVAGTTVLLDSEWNQFINDGYRAMWADVASVNKAFRISVQAFTLPDGTQTLSLPPDFREVYLVRRDPGLDSQEILPRFSPRAGQSSSTRSYRLQNTSLYIEPRQMCAGNYDLLYYPQCPVLSADGDALDAELDQFQMYPIWYAVIEALGREESEDGTFWRLLYGDGTPNGNPGERGRLMKWAATQRSAEPDTVDDVRHSNIWGWNTPPA